MVPRVGGETETEQLRERVQRLEGPVVAADISDEGEALVLPDDDGVVLVRKGWTVGASADDRFVAVSTGDTKPHVLRLTADEQVDYEAETILPVWRQSKLIGDNEADAEGGVADQGNISVEIVNAGDNEQAKIVHDGPIGNTQAAAGTMHGVCGSIYYFDATGHCIGWYTFVTVPAPGWVWTSPWGNPAPDTGDL